MPKAVRAVTAIGGSRRVSVVVQPLVDLGLARAVESALEEADGISNAKLTSLSGDSAVIEADVGSGVSVASALRRGLPVAFDVTDSSDNSVTIRLARPDDDEQAIEASDSGTET